LAALQNGTRRTARLLEQLLALSRYDAGSVNGAPATSLDQCTKEVVADLLLPAADREIDLGFAIVEPVLVRGEPAMLGVMVRNLIDNAIRHIPRGGRVDVGVYREGMRAIIQVEDNGPGIPEADRARIFEPFVRGSGVVEEGSGLGLSIVKRIIEQVNGSLSLKNIAGPAGSGLRVIVSLPSLDQPRQEPAAP
jgi:two-component system OmpR family sensor kinase